MIQYNERKKLSLSFKFLILLGVTGLLFLTFVFLPLFHTQKVIVVGNNDLTSEELIEKGQIPMDQNIYLMHKGKIEERLQQDPTVKYARFSVRFPNILVADVNMRSPMASISFSGGFAIIDEEGTVLRLNQNLNEIVKPLISGIDLSRAEIGEKIQAAEEEGFTMILSLIQNARNAGLIRNISEINLKDVNDIYMITDRGLQVLLGDGDQLNYKMLELSQILVDLNTKGKTTGIVDMRFDSYPVYRGR